MVSAIVLTRLDYCNSILSRLPPSSIAPLQRVQNSATRMIYGLSTPTTLYGWPLYELHFEQWIIHRLLFLNASPSPGKQHLTQTATAKIPPRSRLRSASTSSHHYAWASEPISGHGLNRPTFRSGRRE